MSGTGLSGRTAIVTGAGAGIGRAEALALAAAGAAVVVNDLAESAAAAVVEEVEARGGKALAVAGDVSERACADALLAAATEHFGGLDVVVNNAGVVRDRMVFSMSDEEWDTVVRVHLRGHFLLTRAATAHWRRRSKEEGGPIYGRLVNTASEAFLVGSAGQPNYAAAKAGIAALTVATARATTRYGVRANAICPRARTAMTEAVFGPPPDEGVDPLSVDHVAPFVAFLASPAAERITGQVFVVHGGMVALLAPPAVERRFDAGGDTWTTGELAGAVGGYFADRDADRMFATPEILDLP
ncbi:3-oxoacyl-[acyl-carrier protein] reductase [Amycolatopsis arida]|uniref:3-oxoacyl-[acyl-carrier protein] reductase n=1 Tax=Amycolatopsis arida TaxID=587909 RepID=A0A1I5XLR2_9PSEU|nr:3-oxoacyl-ACP reductase [Amycolatopsis arida]TDX97375.1 3-oxoacyl-[acyl-carrier protein] reductase [Amycolatopsis arida]SFQ32756.1 3-oxoacyl-[acyl-carrier protein] reductase [Amycolatopsis arida]